MPQNAEHLVWVDMEMTGLDPDRDRVIEIAFVVTDARLEIVAEAPVLVVHQSDAVLSGMDAWNTGTHGRSGLTDRVRASTLDEAGAERLMLEFLARHVPPKTSPMCGNSICQDRRFMAIRFGRRPTGKSAIAAAIRSSVRSFELASRLQIRATS